MNSTTRTCNSLILACTTAFAVNAWADTWTDDDDHVWEYTVNETSASVTRVTPCEYDLVIPATLGGKPVTSFGTIFKENTKVASVEIPDTVTEIGNNAFEGCTQLQIVKFGSGIKSIGSWAFSGCSLLQKAELPPATTTLGQGSFNSCVKLTTAKLPGVTKIPGPESDNACPSWSSGFHGHGAFYGCEKLKTLELGSSLTFIGHGAFYGCKELYDVVIPDSVKTVGNYSFAECSKLYSVSFGKNVEQIGGYAFNNDVHLAKIKFDGTALHTFWHGAFNGCVDLNNVVLPEGLEKIYQYGFQGCTALESIVIPDTVTEMGIGVFANCTALKTARLGTGLTVISGSEDNGRPSWSSGFHGYGVFYKCTALTNVLISANIKTIHCGAFYGCSELPEVTIPNKVTDIKGYAFAECANLKKAVIGDGVRMIANHAFYNDIRLEALILGKKVQTISDHAFDTCTALKSVVFPETVLTIGNWAFSNCDSLTKVVLPDSVGVIGTGSFAYCDKLTDMVLGDGLEEIAGSEDNGRPSWSSGFHGYGAFYKCTALTNVVIGSSVATIACGAFYGCSALEVIDLPSCVSSVKAYAFGSCPALKSVRMADNGVRSIGSSAFADNGNLETVTLGNRLQTIGTRAFQNCRKLQNVTFPATLQTMNGWCFEGCTSLTKVVIPNEVVLFDSGVFAYCTALESVSIGDSVITIGGSEENGTPSWSSGFHGYGAFYGCTALKSVDLGEVTTISCGAFYGCSALESITIPDTVITIEPYAFANCSALRNATIGTRLTTLGKNAFDGDSALHYVEFKGSAAPTSVGANVFNGTKDRMTTYVASGSTGWIALYQAGLPESWQGRPIAYGPASVNAGNPYDFYPYVPTGIKISRNTYDWPGSMMLTKTPYLHGSTVPTTVAEFQQGDSIYLTYAYNEYWRGAGIMVMTNEFVLTGAKSARESVEKVGSGSVDYSYAWGTNLTLNILKDLGPGEYTLTMNLNVGKNLAETDYANNTASLTFKVIGRESYTITFDANGGTVDETTRTVWAGEALGTLPVPTAKTGWLFSRWETQPDGGFTVLTADVPTSNTTYYAHWQKNDVVFHADKTWAQPLFLSDSKTGVTPLSSFEEGADVYVNYGYCNDFSECTLEPLVNRLTLDTGASYDQSFKGNPTHTWRKFGNENRKLSMLQNLEPGTHTLTCTLDVEDAIEETNEANNTYTVTFTVTAKGAPTVKVKIGETEVNLVPGEKYGTALKDPSPISGKKFVGWYTGPNGTGTKVTSDSTVPTTATTLYAYWKVDSGSNPDPTPETEKTVKVTIDGKTVELTPGAKYGTALKDPSPIGGKKFVGWYTGPNGTGTKVTSDSTVPATATTLYAYWKVDEQEEPDEPAKQYQLFEDIPGAIAENQTYDGMLQDANGNVAGTIAFKVAKAKKSVSKLTVSIVLGAKKLSYKGEWDYSSSSGFISENKKESRAISLYAGSYGLSGTFGEYTIQGARNVFTSTVKEDKALASQVLDVLKGTYALAFDDADGMNTLSVSIAAKGKVKVSGTLSNGKKASVSSQLIVGDGICCVPVVQSKSGVNLALTLWLSSDGKSFDVVGIDDAKFGKAGTLPTGSVFALDVTALATLVGDATYADYFPSNIAVEQKGSKWVVANGAKAGKVALKKDKSGVDETKLGDNPSGLKLTYTSKTGAFKGTFKAYINSRGVPKAVTVNVAGVMIGNRGYGTATVKKVGISVSVGPK